MMEKRMRQEENKVAGNDNRVGNAIMLKLGCYATAAIGALFLFGILGYYKGQEKGREEGSKYGYAEGRFYTLSHIDDSIEVIGNGGKCRLELIGEDFGRLGGLENAVIPECSEVKCRYIFPAYIGRDNTMEKGTYLVCPEGTFKSVIYGGVPNWVEVSAAPLEK